jgi:enterochelin esterase-like enzyme
MHARTSFLIRTAVLFAGISGHAFAATAMPKPATGRIERLNDFASKTISARNVDIWLPPGYSDKRKYAVLYMQDGQMLFDADTTWNKQEWRADEVAAKLMAEGKVRPFIIVGVHNAGTARNSEYFPQKTFDALPKQRQEQVLNMTLADKSPLFKAPFSGDDYLKFLVSELKPYIDRHYSVYTAASDTAVMGSSRGGLISLYAIMEYPEIFGSAACLSSHWPIKYDMDDNPYPEPLLAYMRDNLPDPASHRLYFDYGTATLDALYPPLQAKADAVLREKGYSAANWQTREFPGAEHSEKAWAERLHIPLQFLFGIGR